MRKKNSTLPCSREDYIPTREKLLYGLGDFFGGGQSTMLSLILLKFFTDGLYIEAGLAGTIIMIAKLWDAISDPLMGNFSDNFRSKWGRRKPFIFLGGVLIIPALLFLFAPWSWGMEQGSPAYSLKVAVVVIAYVVYCTVSTVSQVPYCSLSSEISSDYKQRNYANTFKLVTDMAAAGLCFLIPSLVWEAFEAGNISLTAFWLIISLGFGSIFAITLILCALSIKERTPVPAGKVHFSFKSYATPLKIRSFRWHLVMYIASFLTMDLISTLALYYCSNVLNGVTLFGKQISSLYVIAPMMVVAALSVPLYYFFMHKKSKQYSFRLGMPLYILGAILLAVYQPSWPSWLVPLFAVILGLGFGGAQMMPWLIFPDTVDVAELKLGKRDTGSFSGLMTFSRKACTALAISAVGWTLQLAGYISTEDTTIVQPESALVAVRILLGGGVTLLIVLAFVSSLMYKITDKKLARVRYFLDKQRAGENDTLTSEEKAERYALIDELAGISKAEKAAAAQSDGGFIPAEGSEKSAFEEDPENKDEDIK